MTTATLSHSLIDAQPLRKIDIPGAPTPATRHRWALTGVLAPNGQRVKLQTWRIGGRLVTTPAAVEKFILSLSGDLPAAEADDAMQRRGREAGKALEALGY